MVEEEPEQEDRRVTDKQNIKSSCNFPFRDTERLFNKIIYFLFAGNKLALKKMKDDKT